MRLIYVLVFLNLQFIAYGQDSLHVVTEQKDIKDIFSKGKPDKQTEKPFQFAWAPGIGYTLATGFTLAVGLNGSFRNSKRSDAKLSSISLTVAYTQYRQILLPLIANIWSKDQKWQYSTDWRYMKYPSETWGVEEQRKPEDGFSIDFSYVKIHQLALRAVRKNLFVGTGIYYDNLWNIRELSTPPDGSSSFEKYNLGEPETAFAFPIRVLYDSRLNQINPKNGWFFTLTWRNNFKALGNTKPWQSLVLDLRKYIQVSKSGNVLAFWLYSWQSTRQTPYLLLPSTGWDDNFNTARGYIQGRYRSTNFHYAEAEFRFKITPNGLLGGVAFANLQAYKLNLNEGPYAFAPAVGTGLRIKLNKKSGANLCIDYGIGQHNSHGFFINFSELF